MEGKPKLEVYRLREAELAHGRVSMLASLGFLVQEKFHPLFSGDGGPAIDQIPQLPYWLWIAMTTLIRKAIPSYTAKLRGLQTSTSLQHERVAFQDLRIQ